MNLDFLTPQQAMAAKMALKDMSREEKIIFLEDLKEKEERAILKHAKTDPIAFARRVYPGFKVGPHHKSGKIFSDVLAERKRGHHQHSARYG